MKFGLFIVFVFLCFSGFNQVRIDIPEPYGDNFIESELIQEVTFIPLKFEKFGMITQDMEMKCDGEDFFILDHKETQCVYRFNKEGQLINSICDVNTENANSKGPVLSNQAKFSLNPYKKQIEIFNFENSKIHRFGYDGSALGKIPVEINPSDFIRDSKGNYWVYTGWNNKQSQYRLLKLDQNGKTIDRKMRLVTKCVATEGFSFYSTNTGIYFWELLGNSTFLLKDNEIVETYNFDYGARNLTSNFHEADPFVALKQISENGYFSIKKYLENESYSYFFINFTSLTQKELFHVFYDKKNQRVFVYTENSSIGAFDKAQYLSDQNELVFLVSPRKMKQMLRMGAEFVPAPFVSLDESIGELRDPIILKLKLGEPTVDDGFDDPNNE